MLTDLIIPDPDEASADAVARALDLKTKPPGSLGQIEALAIRMAAAQGTAAPATDPAQLLIFAGDHGLVAEGVSAWPQEVTAQMVANFATGGAAANVLARTHGVRLTVLDAGVATPVPGDQKIPTAGIRAGTRNAMQQDALTADEVSAALTFGAEAARKAISDGARVVALGEMGIGNTATAALLAHAVAGLDLADLAGPGAGLDREGVEKKYTVLQRVAARTSGRLSAHDALAAFGGLEIAAMAGAAIAAASLRAVVVVDGFIATAAMLVAVHARPELRPYLIFAHRSEEPGHRAMLGALDAVPLLDLGLRLGEGSGGLLAIPLLRSATAVLAEMATFDSAGVSGKDA